jgi:hypothetical protein
MQKYGDFSFHSLLAIETLQDHFVSEILISLLGETSTLKTRLPVCGGEAPDTHNSNLCSFTDLFCYVF